MKDEFSAATFIDCATFIKEYTANEVRDGECSAEALNRGCDEGKVRSPINFSKGFELSGACAENKLQILSRHRAKPYRCAALSVEGFVQQLSVAYVSRGYFFYVASSIPEGDDPERIDLKLIAKYVISSSKYVRTRNKKKGEANVQYLRFGRFFVLLATHGRHRFFTDEENVRDIRRHPIRFAGYSIGFGKGRDGTPHASVRIDAVEYKILKERFMRFAVNTDFDVLVARLRALTFEPYAPVRDQLRTLLRAINRVRAVAGLEQLPWLVLAQRRRPVRPFG